MQKYTSANTSINKAKLPKVYNLLDNISDCTIVDYGCGKYTEHIKTWAKEKGIDWYGYDKYNQPSEVNDISMEKVKHADYVICSNVLNVIEENDIILDIIRECTNNDGVSIFTIYDGNRSGKGRATGKDQYQRNQKLNWYLDFAKENGYDVRKWKGSMVID